MSRAGWLQITDYSNKYRISVSTLRRRIKADEIEHFFEDGKYWLPDAPVDRYARKNDKLVEASKEPARGTTRLWDEAPTKPAASIGQKAAPLQKTPTNQDSEALLVAREMVKEMKSAYVQILQEKEEQLLQLKEEITDLRTLCRILETDNERLKGELSNVSSVTSWLDDEPGSDMNL